MKEGGFPNESCSLRSGLASTEEQARNGLSLETQLSNLRQWAADNGHVIVGEYVDAGVSGKKSLAKRPALSSFVASLDTQKVDALVFTKLDRFYRSVKLYYQVVDILDAHNVAWIAIQEDYETLTAAGRFKVNIMLSVAENEADRTSERIKVVLDRKVAMGEYIGNRIPLGLRLEGKHLVPGEHADTIRAAFDLYRQTGSIYRVKDFLHQQGHSIVYITVCRILRNPMYAGRYRDNHSYCEPIIDPVVFDEVQLMLQKRSFRQNQSKRVYLFSGLIRCAYCGKVLVGAWAGNTKDPYRYRCSYHSINGTCPNALHLRESIVEQYLLENIANEFMRFSAELSSPKKKKRAPDKAAIMAKIERLQDLYVEGMIDKQRLVSEREKLLAQIPQEPVQRSPNDVSRLILAADFREAYDEMSREDRRSLWRSAIDHIVADDHGSIRIYFYA